jgi:hypothetical protein
MRVHLSLYSSSMPVRRHVLVLALTSWLDPPPPPPSHRRRRRRWIPPLVVVVAAAGSLLLQISLSEVSFPFSPFFLVFLRGEETSSSTSLSALVSFHSDR